MLVGVGGLTYSGRIVAPVHTGRSGTGPWDRTDRLLRGHSRRTSSCCSCWLLLYWLLATACGDPGWNRRTRCSSWSTCPLHLFITSSSGQLKNKNTTNNQIIKWQISKSAINSKRSDEWHMFNQRRLSINHMRQEDAVNHNWSYSFWPNRVMFPPVSSWLTNSSFVTIKPPTKKKNFF